MERSNTHTHDLNSPVLVLQFGVAVQQEYRVVLVGQALAVERLEVLGQIVDLVSVEELPDDVRGLKVADRLGVVFYISRDEG